MNYTIIQDEARLRHFIAWLPDLLPNETFYVSLLARRKYAEAGTLRRDKAQLKRFTSSKELLLSKIRQLECPLGSYTESGTEPVPQEALALYIMPNPRSLEKAACESLISLARLVTHEYNGYNPHQIVLSEIQRTAGRKLYIDLDFDGVDLPETMAEVRRHINADCLTVVQTRGGFHVLVEAKKIDPKFAKSWHQALTNLPGCDVRGDNMLPIPGCVQGGWSPLMLSDV